MIILAGSNEAGFGAVIFNAGKKSIEESLSDFVDLNDKDPRVQTIFDSSQTTPELAEVYVSSSDKITVPAGSFKVVVRCA